MPLGFVLKTGRFRWLSFSLFLVSSNNNQRSGFFFHLLPSSPKQKEKKSARSQLTQAKSHALHPEEDVFILGQQFCPNFWSNRRYQSKGLRLKLRRLVHIIVSSEETKMTLAWNQSVLWKLSQFCTSIIISFWLSWTSFFSFSSFECSC